MNESKKTQAFHLVTEAEFAQRIVVEVLWFLITLEHFAAFKLCAKETYSNVEFKMQNQIRST